MIEDIPSKNVTWLYNVKVDHDNEIINLVGFTKNGSLISNPIEHEEFLNLSFDMLVHPDAIDRAAILDVDCHDYSRRYFSAIIEENRIKLIVRELNQTTIIGAVDCPKDWTSVRVRISSNYLIINIGEHELSHMFSNKLSPCSIALGNNFPYTVDHIYSFSVKNVEVTTENGVFPLIIDNLIMSKLML
jgi:hypothetical protein